MDALREKLAISLAAYHEAVFSKDLYPLGNAHELLECVAREMQKVRSLDVITMKFRYFSAMLKRADIIEKGGVPLMVICSVCKTTFDAKSGGESYPEDLRTSHGYCPPCFDIEMAKI